VQPGQLIGIVGENGAGKSTLLGLLPRLYDPVQGGVIIDGADIKTFTLESLREQIGIVLQQPILFATTIRENIAYGKADAALEEIIATARAADVHDFIAGLPKGYETVIAEGGTTLSGGQRQKIAIARAIIKSPPILLLDEPTTALDAASAAEVNATLNRLRGGRTTFRIAHRLEDVASADLILVLHEGQIVEQGTHWELCRAGGMYQRISDLQMLAGATRKAAGTTAS
jgi:ABC-type multidrug transport system fused ATPase/permease subunit